jgi:hypothetical protein
MSVVMKVDAEGELSSGQLSPTAGASIQISPSEGKSLKLSLDYKSADQIVVSAAGTMSIAHTGLNLSAGIDRNLVNGATELNGTVSYTISKSVAAEVTTTINGEGVGASASLTIRFG